MILVTKLVRCVTSSEAWGREGDEAHVTAKSIQEILDMIPGTWHITDEPVTQADTAGILFLERYDSQAWRLGNNGTT
jgi:hypothetical protein